VIAAASAELDVLPPSDAETRAVGEGAVGTQIHQMTLKYKFDVGDSKEGLSVVPRVQSLHAQLYDSPLDSLLWRLQDANGATLAYGGAIHDARPTRLQKGSYSVDLLLRHPQRSQLDALKNMPLMLRMMLTKPISSNVYGTRDAPSKHQAEPMKSRWLRRGAHQDVYVAAPSSEEDGALPKWVASGDLLVGELMLDLLEPTVSSFPLSYVVPPHKIEPPKDDDGDGDDDDSDKHTVEQEEGGEAALKAASEQEVKLAQDDEETLGKKILEVSLEQLSSLRKSEASAERYDKLAQSLLAEHVSHLPLLLELLKFSKSVPPPEGAGKGSTGEAGWRADRVAEAADRILSAIDESALALYYGRARDDNDSTGRKAAKKEAKDRGEQRTALRTALLARASAYAPSQLSRDGAHESEALSDRFKDSVKKMKSWLDAADAAADEEEKDVFAITLTKYELAMGRPGSALSTLRARCGAQTPGSKHGRAMLKDLSTLCRELGLEHWATNTDEMAYRNFPFGNQPL